VAQFERKFRLDEAELEFFKNLQTLIGSPAPPLKKKFPETLRAVCGADAAYSDTNNRVVAAAVFFADGQLEETSVYAGTFTFPYFPGLFYLHEGPFVIAAVRNLKKIPDLVCFDAHGTAHPRAKGLATICGMVLELRSIGIAKSHLVGKSVAYKEGVAVTEYSGRKVGLETMKPRRYWSPGHAVSMHELERVVVSPDREICLEAMIEAHRLATEALSFTKKTTRHL